MFKKAIEVDPNYFEANMSMGYVVISPAIDMYNAAAKLPASKQKDYDAAMTKAKSQFEIAKPYLLKAVELNPKSADALNNLLTYYKGKQDAVNIAKINKQIAELK
jgi:tetratricopeptide (TPR) repeat protein